MEGLKNATKKHHNILPFSIDRSHFHFPFPIHSCFPRILFTSLFTLVPNHIENSKIFVTLELSKITHVKQV